MRTFTCNPECSPSDTPPLPALCCHLPRITVRPVSVCVCIPVCVTLELASPMQLPHKDPPDPKSERQLMPLVGREALPRDRCGNGGVRWRVVAYRPPINDCGNLPKYLHSVLLYFSPLCFIVSRPYSHAAPNAADPRVQIPCLLPPPSHEKD